MNKHIISQDATVLEALGMLNALSGGAMTLFVTDSQGRMTGTLTDGDVRRGLLAGHHPQEKVESIMHRDFSSLRGPEIDAAELRAIRR